VRILLINSPQFEFHSADRPARGQLHVLPPLHLGYLAAVAENQGIECCILDLAALDIGLETVVEAITSWQPEVAGISSTTISFPNALRVAQLLKQTRPATHVVMGGCHVTFTADDTLKNHHQVDIVVRGEGEETFAELLRCLDEGGSLSALDGISYRDDDGSIVHNPSRDFIHDLDRLPWPARHLMSLEAYNGTGALFTSRGCPHSCAFCAATAMSGRRYRVRQPQLIVDEIQYLVEHYACQHLSFLDDTFTALPHRLTIPVCREMVRRGLVVSFGCESRVDAISPELVAELKSAGCMGIHFGIESGSQQILDRMHKRITLDQVRDAVRWTAEAGVEVFGSVILGLPGEAEATAYQTRDFLLELRDLGAKEFVVELLVPFPGSDIYEHRDKYEITIHETDWGKFNTRLPIISTPQLSREHLRELYLEIMFDLLGDKLVVGGNS
jgi:radical SAM superfamily enzyme YgiQ (UPF0313 family)